MGNKLLNTKETNQTKNNVRSLVLLSGLVFAMVGMAYAAVPLYQIFCQVTGYGGTTQRVDIMDDVPVLDRKMTVRFDANVSRDLKWEFKPVQRSVEVQLGEQKQIAYVARNLSDKPITGMATFNVTPQSAGAYFNKIECFCFSEKTLQPGEEVEMPVIFFVDPELDDVKEAKSIQTITLSYTFYREEDETQSVAETPSIRDEKS